MKQIILCLGIFCWAAASVQTVYERGRRKTVAHDKVTRYLLESTRKPIEGEVKRSPRMERP